MKSEQQRLSHEHIAAKDKIKDNLEKIKLNKQLPYLVANIVEVSKQESETLPNPRRMDGISGDCGFLKTDSPPKDPRYGPK